MNKRDRVSGQGRQREREGNLLDPKPQIDSLLIDVRLPMQVLFDLLQRSNYTVKMHLSKQGSEDL